MATAAPHVKLLRQLASAKDDYLSGAFDISWDGAKATLYLVFGRPSHAVFDTDQAQIEGEAAIDALLAELPRTFAVSDWRRAMSPQETLSISIDELAGPFVRLAGSYADDPVLDETPEWWSAEDSSPDLPFGLADFPLLPGGRPLWAETSPENVNLAERLAGLPPSIIILTGPKLRAAAVVSGGDLIDAVWIDEDDQARGEAAAMALLGATKGSLAGYALDDPRVADALTMLWRLPLAVGGIEMAWLDPASMLAAFRADGLDRVLIIDAPLRGIALFSRGGLVAVYSETQRSAVASPERLRSLLSQPKGRLTVLERKPRPVTADAGAARTTAADFFAVADPEVAPAAPAEPESEDGMVAAEPAGEPVDVAPEPAAPSAEGDLDAEPAATEAAEGAAAADPVEPVAEARATVPDPVSTPWYRPFAARAGAQVAESAEAPTDSAETPTVVADDDAAPAVESEDRTSPAAETVPDTWEAPPPALPAEDLVPIHEPAEVAEPAVGVAHADPPPPPPPDADLAIDAADTSPPAPLDVPTEPAGKTKRGWRIFGRSRKRRAAETASEDAVTMTPDLAPEQSEAETASPAGWSVRQPGTAAQPVWSRPKAPAETVTPEEPSPAAASDTATPEYTWSVVDRTEPAHTEPESPPPLATEIAAADAAAAHDLAIPEATDTAVVDAPAPPLAHDVPEDGAHGGLHDPSIVFEVVEQSQSPIVPEAPREQPRDFWAEFASPDLDADQETAPFEPQTDVPEAQHDPEPANAELPLDVATPVGPAPVDESTQGVDAEAHAASEPAPGTDAADADDQALDNQPADPSRIEPTTRPSSGRTLAPWSWPLAEVEVPVAAGPSGIVAASPIEDAPVTLTAGTPMDLESHDADHAPGADADQGFFQRDEPVGSQFVDFDEVRTELVQIGVVWLGESSAAPVTALLLKTRSTIDDFVASIDTIRGLHIEGQDPASVQAMAREMHQQAAERLSGA